MFRWIALKAIDRVLNYVDKKLEQDPNDGLLIAVRERLLAARTALVELKNRFK